MILITESPGGELSGAFAVQPDREVCETKLPGITAVVETTGVVVREAVCVPGDWQFSRFLHSFEEENIPEELHTYLVTFDDSKSPSVTVTAVTSKSECMSTLENESADKGRSSSLRLYCVSSRQRLPSGDE